MTGFVHSQIGLERAALGLLERSDVRAAVTAAALRWRAGTPGLLPQTYDRLGPSIDEVALLVALQVVNGDPARPQIVEISAGPHTWGGLDVPGGRWGINNPDTLYFAAPVAAGSRYLLYGRPSGGEPPADINITVQTPDVWGTLDSIGRRELALHADGSFVVTIGNQMGPNCLAISEGGTVLLIRQTLADWSRELPYELSIERVDGPVPATPATEDEQARRLIERLELVVDHSLRTLQPPIFELPANTIPQPGPAGDKPGYLVAQRNTLGHFRLTPDDALVLVVTPGRAGYVAVAAPNVWGVTTDSARHLNSLNNHQAVLDPDGRMTVVVADVDPGIANWIDPGGLTEGIVMLRWQLLAQQADATDQPAVAARLVRASELAQALPSGTPEISPKQRENQLAARAAGYSRRFELR